MDINKRLQELLNETAKLVPTMMFVGRTKDNFHAFMMASPKDGTDDRIVDICKIFSEAAVQHKVFRDMIFSVVCWYMQDSPQYREWMQEALDKMKELDNAHKGTAGGE